MAEPDIHDFAALARTVLVSLRRTLDAPYEAISRQKELVGEALRRSMLMDIEAARLLIAPLRNARQPMPDAVIRLTSLSRELTRFVSNQEYAAVLRTLKYRRFPDPPQRVERNVRIIDIEAPTALAAIEMLIERIGDVAAPPSGDAVQRELFQLRSIIPAQKIAPAQFEIKNDRLIVKTRTSDARDEDVRSLATSTERRQDH